MSLNLLELAKGYITDAAIQKLSGSVGESPSATKSALDGILPAILGGVVNKATSGGGGSIGSVMDLIKGANSDGDLLGKVTGILKGSGGDNNSLTSLGTMGSWLTDSIFGDKAKSIVDSISTNAGIKKESAISLMSMAGPLLMGVLGKQIAGGMSASGLMSLLSSQKEHIEVALPTGLSGLAGTLGLSALGGNIGKSATDAFGKASGAIGSVGGKLGDAAGGVGGAINGATGGGMPKWLLSLLGLLLAGGLIWYLMKNCGGDKIAESATAAMDSSASMAAGAAGTVVNAADSAGSMAAGAVSTVVNAADSAGNEAAGVATAATGAVAGAANVLGTFFKKKLPDGIELNIPENGIENKLIGFIEDKSKAVDKTTWFSFDRLEFETGKLVLKASSQEQLANIAAVLKAYPNVNIKLGGYTDNTGNAASNMKLSDVRAKSTVKALEALGIAATRLEAEGYGDQHPIGDNTTAEGRQKNRRIEVRVTKK